MIYRIALGLAVTLVVTTASLHAQEMGAVPELPDTDVGAPLASVSLPHGLDRSPVVDPAAHLSSLLTLEAKPKPGSVRADVLQRLSATVRDTDLARLNDIYSAH